MGLIAGLMSEGPRSRRARSRPRCRTIQPGVEVRVQGPEGVGEQAQGAYRLDGTVVSSRENKLYIKSSDGAVVAVDVNHKTRIDGKELSKSQNIQSHLQREFKEGDQVRTSFAVEKKTENVATSIDKSQK